jgi:hypothetical protein
MTAKRLSQQNPTLYDLGEPMGAVERFVLCGLVWLASVLCGRGCEQ